MNLCNIWLNKATTSLPTTTKKKSGEGVSNKEFQPAQTSGLIAFCWSKARKKSLKPFSCCVFFSSRGHKRTTFTLNRHSNGHNSFSTAYHSSQLLLTIKPITEDWFLKINLYIYSKSKCLLFHITAAIGGYMLAYCCLDL